MELYFSTLISICLGAERYCKRLLLRLAYFGSDAPTIIKLIHD